jgi:hypothetical protein
MGRTVMRSDRLDRRKLAAGLAISALVHIGLIGGLAFGSGSGGVGPLAASSDRSADVDDRAIEVVRMIVPVAVEASVAAAASPTVSTPAPAVVAPTGSLARLLASENAGLAFGVPAPRPAGGVSTGALAHVPGVSSEGLWTEYDAWAESLVTRRTDETSAEDWFRALQDAARPACGPPILINR